MSAMPSPPLPQGHQRPPEPLRSGESRCCWPEDSGEAPAAPGQRHPHGPRGRRRRLHSGPRQQGEAGAVNGAGVGVAGSGAISSITTVRKVQSPVLTGQRTGGRSLLLPGPGPAGSDGPGESPVAEHSSMWRCPVSGRCGYTGTFGGTTLCSSPVSPAGGSAAQRRPPRLGQGHKLPHVAVQTCALLRVKDEAHQEPHCRSRWWSNSQPLPESQNLLEGLCLES